MKLNLNKFKLSLQCTAASRGEYKYYTSATLVISQSAAPDMVTTSKGAQLDLNNNSVKLHQTYTIYAPTNTP